MMSPLDPPLSSTTPLWRSILYVASPILCHSLLASPCCHNGFNLISMASPCLPEISPTTMRLLHAKATVAEFSSCHGGGEFFPYNVAATSPPTISFLF
ncbi:hypothetical protein L484_014868 [Morus notabilis]|uniref:Uncharacterized protein n=1 Tax=Morus notabilis TaxID=981085 RepID=W9SCM2_9ROSA|nr:hypothetical protein L484_014868 [Morus notabilis]